MTLADEIVTVAASRLLADHRVVFAGIGVPLSAAVLAKRTHAPNLTIILEGGIIGANPADGHLPRSTNEMSGATGAEMLTGITDIFLLAQRGFFDYGFLGVAQIDKYGNINTSILGPHAKPKVRLPGTGGANDIISLCNQTFVVTRHERRKFVEHVDFVTSPGYLSGGTNRADSGLVYGGLRYVVTELALMDFEPASKRMRLRALQPGVTIADVTEATGFELVVGDDVEQLEPPSADELAMLRKLTDTDDKAA